MYTYIHMYTCICIYVYIYIYIYDYMTSFIVCRVGSHGDIVALVVRDKGTGWIAACHLRGSQAMTYRQQSTIPKARKQSHGDTQMGRLSCTPCAATSEYGMAFPAHTVRRRMAKPSAPTAQSLRVQDACHYYRQTFRE